MSTTPESILTASATDIGLGDWPAFLSASDSNVKRDPSGWVFVTGLDLTQARTLLDWLENHGIREPEVSLDPSGHLSVRWQAKPAK